MFEGVVATVLNRFLGNYVTNLETTQLKLGIWQGDVKLEKLRLKTDALDKLHLPIDVKEGWLGTLTISIPWANLKGEPVRININDVFLLATPRFQENFNAEEEEEREFNRKMRKLESEELIRLHQKQQKEGKPATGEERKQASFTEQLVTKIVDNLQIVIKNIHIRYEDNVSNPERMFAIGATLGELSAVSTDEEWRPTFLHDSGSVIRKMLKLTEFSVYWDTDCESFQGMEHERLLQKFALAIGIQHHQMILQPVVGLGKLTMNKRPAPEDIRTVAKFEFDQLAFELDDEQYVDALLLTTQYDYAMRQRRYRKHHPPPGVRPKDDPKAWLLFAMRSVYDEVHDHNYRKTGEFLEERRDDRLLFLRIYTAFKVNNGQIPEIDRIALDKLNRKLSFQDIRFYRALAEPKIKKQMSLIRKRKDADSLAAHGGSYTSSATNATSGAGEGGVSGWVGSWFSRWGSSAAPENEQAANAADGDAAGEAEGDDSAQLTEKQVQELYNTIEFNEEEVADAEYDLPKETIKLAASALLKSGSLKLKVDRKTRDHTLMGFFYDFLKVDLLQRPQNIAADVSVHRFEVVDGTLPDTQYPRMIYVQSENAAPESEQNAEKAADEEHELLVAVADAPGGLAATESNEGSLSGPKDPFLKVHFEKDPLDGHADSVVNMKVKSLNVVYHPTAAKAIVDFFEPPSSASAESMHALIAAASKSVAGLRDQTRAGLEYALAKHKTVDVKVDFDAPVFVIPQDVTDPHSQVVVLDSGYLTIESQLVDSITSERIRQRQSQVLTAQEMKELESLMYDHFDMRLHSTQLLVGNDLAACMQAIRGGVPDTKLHIVDRIELNFDLGLCILSEPPLHMPKVTVDGGLPSLQVFFSDRKYKAIMNTIDLILEAIEEEQVDVAQQYEPGQHQTAFGAGGLFIKSAEDSADNAADPALALEGTAQASTGTTPQNSDDMDGSLNDDNDGNSSVDEFFETTDQIGEAESAAKLRRKKNREARRNIGKEPERVTVRVNFAVDNLVGFIWRSHTDGRDDLHIADIAVTGFAVECKNRPFDLFADVTIHQITIEDHLMNSHAGSSGVYALTSDIAQADANGETDKNLVVVKYHKRQADHPEFSTAFESIGQTVEVDISYLDLMVVRKTILTSYDFILKTFTNEKTSVDLPNQPTSANAAAAASGDLANSAIAEQGEVSTAVGESVNSLIQEALDTIRVDVRFKGTDFGFCHDDGSPIALLSVTAANMRVMVTQQTIVEAKIGSITLSDQLDLVPTQNPAGNYQFQQQRKVQQSIDPSRLLLYVRGDELADFKYETFDPKAANYPGHNAAITLRVGAAHMAFVERPIRELMLFGSRFSAMHELFEAARQAAAYGTTQLTEEMMGGGQKIRFDISMSAPVITFPRDGFMPYSSLADEPTPGVDMLVAQPGELVISNEFTTVREIGKDWDVNHISLSLRHMGIKTVFVVDSDASDNGTFGQPGEQVLQILEDVDYNMDMHILVQGHISGCPRPVTELIGTLSPVKMKLTEYQYKMVYDLLGVIGRVFGTDPNAPVVPDPLINDRLLDLAILRENPATSKAQNTRQALANLRQIPAASGKSGDEGAGLYATMDLYVTLSTIQLELFQGSGFHLERIQKASFTRADINGLAIKYRSKANGDSKAELSINAVRAYDTRPDTDNQFTQLISPTIVPQAGASPQGSASEAAAAANSRTSMHALAQDTPVEEDANNPQLICHIDMRPNQDMVVLLTMDSPRIILVLDHAFLLLGFVTSVLPQQDAGAQMQAPAKSTSPGDSIDMSSNSTGGLIYKLDILHPEIILLADPKSRSSEALILSINQLILAQEGMSCMTVDEIGVSLCSINRRRETSRSVMDPFTMITTIDSRVTLGDHQLGTQTHTVTDIAVDVGSLLLRLGINDIILLMDIFNTAMELLYKSNTSQQGQEQEQEQEQGRAEAGKRKITAVSSGQAAVQQSGGSTPASAVTPVPAAAAASRLGSSTLGSESAASAPATLRKTRASSSVRDSPDMSTRPSARIIKETMRATVASMRVVIIRDMSGLPVYACSSKEFHVDVTDWSVNMRVKSDLQLQMSYFNRRNSHWEPFVEPWSCALNVVSSQGELGDQMTQKIDINSTDRLHLNVSHAFIETTLSLISQWGDEMERHKKHQKEGTKPVGERMPYVLINRTGIDCHVWVDLPEGIAARSEGIDTSPVLLRDGESLPWRFEDWRRRREQLEAKSHHLGIQFANGQWEWLRRVQVDCEGVKHYSLQPPVDDILHRVAVEVTLDSVNLVKRVVLRSPLVVENQTRVAMEVSMCDYRGELRTDSTVIQPGEELPLPIMFCHQYAVRARPEAGFGYAWSSRYIYWRDFLGQDARTELCCLPNATATALHQSQRAQSHAGEGEVYGGGRNTGGSAYRGSELDADVMPFFIHFNALCDARNPSLYKYPFMRLVMTPPLEIENLLPYAMSICVIDKTANRKWVSSLKRGGISPVHAVQPGHLVLLSARIPDAGFDLCEGTIIESNDEDEYPADTDLVMTDREGLKLALKIHRMDIPNSGGRCRRISIYAPYVMVNRTGLKLFYSSKGFFKGVSAIAGQNVHSNTPLPPISGDMRRTPPNEFMRRRSGMSGIIDDTPLSSRPLMFSFGSYDFRNRALVRVTNSEWSRPLSFDALGSTSEFIIPSTDKLSDTHLGIEIEPGRGRYSHTRVVTFSSRYVVKNLAGMSLQYRTVYNTTSSVLISDGERRPLHTLHRARRRLLTIACACEDENGRPVASIAGARWSAPFSIDEVGRVFIRLPSKASESGEILVKVDIIMEGACLFVIMQRESRYWPYRIENRTQVDITVWQQKEKNADDASAMEAGSMMNAQTTLIGANMPAPAIGARPTRIGEQSTLVHSPTLHASSTMTQLAAFAERKYLIRAGESLDYAWDVPTVTQKLLVISAQGSIRRISLQEIGEQRPFVYGKPPAPPRRGSLSASSSAAAAIAAQATRALVHYTMNIEVAASGPRQVLKLTSYAPETSLYAPQIYPTQPAASARITRSPTAQSSTTQSSQGTSATRKGSGDERFEVVGADEKTNVVFRFGLEGGIGVSMINKYASEILFATLSDVEFKFTDSTTNQTAKLTVKWIQIDNQIYGALYPIVLYPTTLGSVAMTGLASPPALQAVVVRSKDSSYGVEYFKYASVLAQELSLELDEDFLYALLDFVKFDVPGWNDDVEDEEKTGKNMVDSAIPEVKAFDDGLQLYFEFLHIQPFKLNISFMRTQRLDVGGDPTTTRYPTAASAAAGSANTRTYQKNRPSITSYNSQLAMSGGNNEKTGEGVASNSGIVAYATNVLTMAIGNINEAPVFLNALIMQNVRVSLPILSDRMYKHYSQEVFNQVYKVVGSANFLGNPVGLFNNISSGVSDFFYEPYQGFVMSDRPQDFGFGLARGTASLFKKTVFGMTDSFSKFTDSVSKGLSAATLDPQYQTERSLSRVRNKPKHAIYGVARGAESFAKSVGSGIAGVVMRPIEGAEQEGVGGFFKGVGKGLVGVVTKPMIGMFDLASNVTEGIRNTTTVFERDLDRQRLPRHVGRDGIITVYSSRESLGQAWMRELNKGAYAYDNYLAHLELPGSDMVVLLTYQRLVMFRRAKPDEAGMAVGAAGSSMETGSATGAIGVSAANASKAQVEWEQEIRSLHSIQLEATGISLKLPATPEGYVPPGPFIPISDGQSRRWFYNRIKEAVKALIDDSKEY